MYQKIKAFFYHISKRKIYSFPLIATALLLFPKITFAAFWDTIVGAITQIPTNVIILLAQGVIGITSLLAATASKILEWVLSPGFTNLSYTNPSGNSIIEIGLNITQSFVNMALVLVLVFIAFATILRLKEYQTQKLLITLVVVALLVNFAPVICGLIIDPCNILMHYFTDHITGFKTVINISSGYNDRLSAMLGPNKFTEQLGMLTESLVLIIFNFILFFLILLYALIFMVRYAVIWVLVILSPLAFVSYILPATKKIWNQWWNQFLSWSIIGITTGFFLYLSEQVAEKAPDIIHGAPESESMGGGAMNLPLQYMVPLIFMFIGLMFAFQTSAMGASQILVFAKKGGQKARGWAEKGGKKGVAGVWKGYGSGIRGAAKGAKQGKGFKEKTGGFFKGFGKGITPQGQAETGRWVRRQGEKARPYIGIGDKPGTTALEEKTKITEAEKRIDALPIKEQQKIAKGKTFLSEEGRLNKTAALNNLAREKKVNDDEIKEIRKMVDKGEKGLDLKAIIDARPEEASRLTGVQDAIKQHVQKKTARKLLDDTQAEAFEKFAFIRHLDKKQLDYIATSERVSNKIRRNMLDEVIKNKQNINTEMVRLMALGTDEAYKEAERIHDLEMAVTGPNFVT